MDLITHQQSRRSQGMTDRPLTLVLVSTPIGQLGSGRGGGVELTFTSVLKGLADRGHHLHVVAPSGSHLPAFEGSVTLHTVPGLISPAGSTPTVRLHADSTGWRGAALGSCPRARCRC